MPKTIFCKKLQKEAEGFDIPPYPGSIGEKIMQNISKAAWQMWLERQTMLINEYRLNMLDAKAREFLLEEMHKFLFEDAGTVPQGYVPQDKS